MARPIIQTLLLAAVSVAALGPARARADGWEQELAWQRQKCMALFPEWQQTHDPPARARLREELVDAAIQAERPGIVEQVAADGPLGRKEIRLPHRARCVPLRELRVFDGIKTTFDQEDGHPLESSSAAGRWLVRRLTRDAWEVWTPAHGWLLDGGGHVLNEARPVSADGSATGREWFGAFLPDGRWVTTELDDGDGALTFFSRAGQRTRSMTSAELAPPGPYDPRRTILGWARSDKDGAAWVVNVGTEQGYATVRVEPEGPARVLTGIERWQLCYPRALGPRGWYIDMNVPDDAGRTLLAREAAGHGMGVGFPTYSLEAAQGFTLERLPGDQPADQAGPLDRVRLPDGNDVFGFWPGGQDMFIGTENVVDAPGRKPMAEAPGKFLVDKTWFFDRRWRLHGWMRARRLADAADGRSLLLRADDDGRVVTLRPTLRAAAVRRFVWPDGATADVVTLFDDLQLGLFVRRNRLVLAGW